MNQKVLGGEVFALRNKYVVEKLRDVSCVPYLCAPLATALLSNAEQWQAQALLTKGEQRRCSATATEPHRKNALHFSPGF